MCIRIVEIQSIVDLRFIWKKLLQQIIQRKFCRKSTCFVRLLKNLDFQILERHQLCEKFAQNYALGKMNSRKLVIHHIYAKREQDEQDEQDELA